MPELNRAIFFSNETSGTVTHTITQATGDASLDSREILEDSDSVTERILLIDCADDDTSTPTIAISISLYIGNGWTEYTTIEAASVVPKQVVVTAYGKDWWKKNNGVKFRIAKVGAGAVTHSNGYWV